MRWNSPRLPDVRRVTDKFNLYGHLVNKNRAIIVSNGAPATFWRNTGLKRDGSLNTDLTRCYCWDEEVSQPDKKHFLCAGTGFLGGYQKYGYNEIVTSTTSTLTKDAAIITTGSRGSSLSLSGGAITGTVDTEKIYITDFIEIDYFLINEKTEDTNNRIKYYYTLDDATWTEINITDYTGSKIANKQGDLSNITEIADFIKFRMVFQKRYTTSAAPMFNSIRFRYRNQLNLGVFDDRFSYIQVPSFLASKENTAIQLQQQELGLVTKYPLRFWTLPDAILWEGDIFSFLTGEFSDYKYEIKNVNPFMYGPQQIISHRSFDVAFIRDNNDLMGIAHHLI